MKGGYTETKQM